MTVPQQIRFSLLSTDPQNSISPASVPDEVPASILYLRVNYIVDEDDTLSDVWAYGKKSGTYPLPLDVFLDALINGQPLPARVAGLPLDGVPVIGEACYVVFAIDMNGPAKFVDTDAMTTNDITLKEYFNLTTLDDDGEEDSSFPQHIAYFQAIDGSVNGKYGVVDRFNLNLDMGTIDPDIKNTGHKKHKRDHGD